MPDKMEREIEEILARLDDGPGGTPDKTPVSIMSRKKRSSSPGPRPKSSSAPRFNFNISPPTLLFAGAGIMIAGLILSTVYSPLIWASFAGVVVFLLAFGWSFRRTPRSVSAAGATAPRGHYWRDRYIEYEPSSQGIGSRIKKRFRK